MAHTSTPGSSSTEFFITEEATRFLDYNYTIFGVQTAGSSVNSTIAAMPNQNSTQDPNGVGYLQTPVTITSASIFTDNQGGVLQISAPKGVTGTVNITVTASDGVNAPVTQSFVVTISADSTSNPANPYAAKIPTAPTGVTCTSVAVSNGQTNLNNSTAARALQFLVSGVTSGNIVEILADGNVIGQATASGTSVTVQTNGTFALTDGAHKFTAIQIAPNQTVSVTESGSSTPLSKTADVPSFNSASLQLTIDTVGPQFNFAPAPTAVVGVPYSCHVSVSGTATGTVYSLVQSPAGMSIDANTGVITWTPTSEQLATTPVNVQATDAAGNSAQQQYSINVLADNAAPVLVAHSPVLGTTDENTAKTIALAAFINNGNGTTGITDADTPDAWGGIAVTSVSGGGTWAYTLDGTNFTDVGTVSASSALLLPSNASLRFTPDGANGSTATIAYRAWDTTGGAAGVTVDLSQSSSLGGKTAYSTDSDAASLTVTSLNDAPVATPASPSLGSIDSHAVKTISLATFVKSGAAAAGVNTGVTDVDTGAAIGGIALTAVSGSGTWKYSLDGTTFTAVGAVSNTAALLLPSNATLQYTPVAGTAETASISYRAWDTTTGAILSTADTTANGGTTAFSTSADTASLLVTTNNAPVLTAHSPSLGSVAANGFITINLTQFINNGSSTTAITDSDTGAAIGGIALTGVTGNGTWSYTTDGTTFTAVGAVSGTSALLLPKTAQLRYTAAGSGSEAATITYRAWDTTSGAAGTKADTSGNGGVTAFSTATDTASLAVGSCSISGFVYIDADNDGLRSTSAGQPHMALQGAAVTLLVQSSASTWSTLSSTTTASDGSYHFNGLAAGTYRVAESQPANYIDGKESLGRIGGTTSGTASQDQFEIQLATGDVATEYNFGERGLKAGSISLRMSLASTPIGTQTTTPIDTTGDTTAPSGYSITAGSSLITTSTASSTSFIFAGAEVGATYNYTVVSDGGAGTLTGSGTVTSATQQVTGINVSSLTDGMLTYTVTLTDGAGNSGPHVVAIATLDRTAPSGYAITAIDDSIGSAKATATGFAFTGAELLTTYHYTITSSSGGTPLTGAGTITSTTQQLTPINVSSLPDGTLTYSVTLTDAAGNVGAAATATATLDRTAPAGYTVTADQSVIDTTTASATGFTIVDAEPFTTYNYTISSSGGGTPVTGTGTVTLASYHVGSIDVSTLPDGVLTISVTLTDEAGNAGSAATATASLATTAPSGYAIIAGDSLINADEAATTSFTFSGAELGTTYNYVVTSSGGSGSVTGSGTIASSTQQVTGIDVSSLPDGILTYSVTLTDAASLVGDLATAAATLDKTAPTDYTIAADESTLDETNATTAGFTFTGAEVGATYVYTVSSSGGGDPVTGTGAIASAGQQITGINVSGLPDGTLTFSVILTDAAGNAGAAATATAVLDQFAPQGYSITADQGFLNAASAATASFTFADAELDATYHYVVTSSGGSGSAEGSGTITSATQQVAGIDVSSLPEGTLTFSVTLTDAGSKSGDAATATALLDATAPSGYTVTPDQSEIGGAGASTVGFVIADAEPFTTYNYTITSSGGGTPVTGTGTTTLTSYHVINVNVSSLPDGVLTISVTLTDEAGNTGPAADTTMTLDATAPTGYTIAADDATLDQTNATAAGFTFAGAELGATYSYTITSSGGGARSPEPERSRRPTSKSPASTFPACTMES